MIWATPCYTGAKPKNEEPTSNDKRCQFVYAELCLPSSVQWNDPSYSPIAVEMVVSTEPQTATTTIAATLLMLGICLIPSR